MQQTGKNVFELEIYTKMITEETWFLLLFITSYIWNLSFTSKTQKANTGFNISPLILTYVSNSLEGS